MRSTILGVLLVAAAPLGAADLSLDAAVAAALDNNPEITAATERVSAAAARSDQARAHRWPSIDLLSSYGATDVPAESFALQLNQRRFDMEQFFASDPNRPDTLSSFVTRLDISLPVYTGGKLSSRIGQAADMLSKSELEARYAREHAAFQTIEAYLNLSKAREHLDLAQRSRDTSAAHLDLASQYADEGLILTAEVLKAKVHLAEIDEMVADARSGTKLAESALNFHMGADQGTARELSALPANPPVSDELDSWIDRGLRQRLDLEAARRQLAAGEKEISVQESKFKPEVALMGSYGIYDDDLLGSNGHSGSIMAVARINLFRGGADQSAVAAAQHDLRSGQADVERYQEGIRLEIEQSWRDLNTARIRHQTAEASVTAAEEALRVREQRFSQGLDKMIDLVDAETALHQARLRELVARYDLALATYRLYFTSGESLTETLGLESAHSTFKGDES